MTSYNDYQNGTLVQYQFLWSREASKGQVEGTKRRPCAIILRSPLPSSDRIFLIPVTTKEPDEKIPALEIPELEARRMGLNEPMRRWIILNEINVDEIPSYVLEPNAKIGQIGVSFFRTILLEFKKVNDRRKIIQRSD